MIKTILSYFLIFQELAAYEDQFNEAKQENLKLFNPFYPQKIGENHYDIENFD